MHRLSDNSHSEALITSTNLNRKNYTSLPARQPSNQLNIKVDN